MNEVLNQLIDHKKLNREQAKEVLINISSNLYNSAQIAAFITVYLMRSISAEELEGFKEALLEMCIPVDLEQEVTIDLCGTGGDSKNTFNISTLASFIVAGAGYKVAKHGNYGVSSISGSSNVIEKLGFKFTNNTDLLKKQITSANICFMHAPLFHPALRSVAPIRKDLGIKTFFNMLGPLVNPSKPNHQMVGVFNLQLVRLYQYLMEKSHHNYAILHSMDGYDEISLTSEVKIVTKFGEGLYRPDYFKSTWINHYDIYGGADIDSSLRIFTNVIEGRGSEAQNKVVLANAAFAIQILKPLFDFETCYELAKDSLFSGKAKICVNKLLSIT